MHNLLAGCKVVNLAYYLPGPLAAQKLASYGASIIKVEPPDGDPLKSFCPEWYAELVAGQEIKKFNLKSAADSERFHQLLSRADILLTSMRPSALRRLGLGWNMLGPKYKRLCHVEIIGYQSPDEEEPGHDLNFQAKHGLLSPPEMPRMLLADFFGAELAVQTALMLLVKRSMSGENGHMSISLANSLERLSWPLNFGLTGPEGLLGGGIARYNLYKTKDSWVALAALEDKYWSRLISELGLPNQGVNKEKLDKIFLQKNSDEWEVWARENDLPITAVRQ